MDDIIKKIESLKEKLSKTRNENEKLDIIFEINMLNKKLREESVNPKKKEEPVVKPQQQFQKPEFKKEEKKEDPKPDNDNRGKVTEPANIHNNQDNNKNNKK